MRIKNQICIRETGSEKQLIKTYGHKAAKHSEEFVLNSLGQDALVPTIISSANTSLTLSLLDGKTARYLLEEYEATNNLEDAKALLDKIYSWLLKFYSTMKAKTGRDFIKGDNNLDNFLIVAGEVYGIDFEESRAGMSYLDIAEFVAFLLCYHPENTTFKQQLASYFLELSYDIHKDSDINIFVDKNIEKIRTRRYLKNKTLCCTILAGGKSSRMGGNNKALLPIDESTFIERILYSVSFADEINISVSTNRDILTSHTKIYDTYDDIGPLGAIATVLEESNSDTIFFTPCDTPFWEQSTVQKFFYAAFTGTEDAVIAIDEDGEIYPLCGVYKKSCLPIIKDMIADRMYKVRKLYSNISVRYLEVDGRELRNINTPEEYREFVLSL